ncbi:MAG: DUF975 family protein [Clostridia bacterium]|nr:DUF975 family protein [Clostridia bacterium]
MQPTFQEIKSAAKTALKHRWSEAIAATMLLLVTVSLNTVMQLVLMNIFKVDEVWSPFSPTAAPDHNQLAAAGLTLFSAAFTLFVIFPLAFGIMRWFWMISNGCDARLSEMFGYFSSGKLFFRTIRLSLALFFRLVLGAVVCYLPYSIVAVITTPKVYEMFSWAFKKHVSGLIALAPTLKFLGTLGFFFWISTYILFFAVMYTESDWSVRGVIRRAVQISKGNRLRFIGFILSFFGWLLSCLFIFPLPFVLPYVLASTAVYGREALRFARQHDSKFAVLDV